MLKRVTAICVVLCLLLPTLCVSASAHSILWVSTSDHTDLVKDEEYEAASAVLFMAPGVDDDATPMVEGTDGGLVILYEEPVPEGLAGVDEVVQPEPISVEEEVRPELISVEEEPEAELEEIELEENTNGEIQEP